MDVFVDILKEFLEAIWKATDPFGIAFAILGTHLLTWFEGAEDPVEKKDRTAIQRLLPLIPVFLGMSWVVLSTLVLHGKIEMSLAQRCLATGCSALAVHKIWRHTVKNT